MKEISGTLVDGRNGQGNRLDTPAYLFVDRDHSVCVSDLNNYRVIKWLKSAREGVVVASGQGERPALTQ